MRSRLPHAITRRVAAATICLMLVVSCGGVGSDGSGAPPQTLGNGTVTGFGSVIIDGVAFDNRMAPTVVEVEPGKEIAAEAQLGDRLEVVATSAGVAQSLRVEPTVVGKVSGLVVGGFQALGQTVLVNADPALGPVTQLEGYGSVAEVQVGDTVTVHGLSKASGTAQVVQATRIVKRTDAAASLRVAGLVQGLGTGSPTQFRIGALIVDYGTAALAPAGAMLSEGASVVAFAPAERLGLQPDGTWRLAATALRVKSVSSDGIDTYASGIISALDAVSGRFRLEGSSVTYSAANVSPPGAVLANGMYVQARGMVGANGVLAASLVTVRDGRQPESELKGTIVGFNVAAGTFLVRDVLVTLGSASIDGCPAAGLQDGLFVEVEGSMNASGVTAKEVECIAETPGSTVEREGIASSVDTVASQFTLQRAGGASIRVQWTALTFFGNVTPQSLNGAKIEVEGVMDGAVLRASKIKRDDP